MLTALQVSVSRIEVATIFYCKLFIDMSIIHAVWSYKERSYIVNSLHETEGLKKTLQIFEVFSKHKL